MPNIRQERSVSDAIAAQTVRDEASRLVFQPMQQALEEALGSRAVPPLLHQDVQHDAMLVHRPPQIVQHAEFLNKYAPNIPVTRAMDVFEGPISNRKLRDVLGFRQEHDWRTQRPG